MNPQEQQTAQQVQEFFHHGASEFDSIYSLLTGNGIHINAFVSLSAQSRMVAESFGIASRPPSFAAGDAGGSLGLAGRGKPAIGTPPVPALDATDSVAEAGAGPHGFWLLKARDAVAAGLFTGPVVTLLVVAALMQNWRRKLRGGASAARPSGGYR